MDNKTLNGLTALSDFINSIATPARKIREVVEVNNPASELAKWQQRLLPLINIQMIEMPGINDTTPLALYYNELRSIATPILSIQEPLNNLESLRREVEEGKAIAERNLYLRLCNKDHEREIEAKDKKIDELKAHNAELETKTKEIEIALRTIIGFDTSTSKPHKKATLSLKPCITPSQIVRLYEATKWLFTSTLDQWSNLLSEEIQVFEAPIILQSTHMADVRILFYYLRKYDLIGSDKYPSTLENGNVFSYNGKTITAKQLNAVKENPNYPHIGNNYVKIEEIISRL